MAQAPSQCIEILIRATSRLVKHNVRGIVSFFLSCFLKGRGPKLAGVAKALYSQGDVLYTIRTSLRVASHGRLGTDEYSPRAELWRYPLFDLPYIS
jgi:hypothetical protein